MSEKRWDGAKSEERETFSEDGEGQSQLVEFDCTASVNVKNLEE